LRHEITAVLANPHAARDLHPDDDAVVVRLPEAGGSALDAARIAMEGGELQWADRAGVDLTMKGAAHVGAELVRNVGFGSFFAPVFQPISHVNGIRGEHNFHTERSDANSVKQ
jgi:hypothetical protein